MTKVPCGFSDVASPDFYQEEGYGALGLSLAVSRSLSLSPSLFRSLNRILAFSKMHVTSLSAHVVITGSGKRRSNTRFIDFCFYYWIPKRIPYEPFRHDTIET